MVIRSVHAVDRGANKRKFLVTKRDAGSDTWAVGPDIQVGPDGSLDVVKAEWSTAVINDLPDSSFLYVMPGGEKDADGKTVPRTNRMFPYRTEGGEVDLPHLRNALARIPQSSLSDSLKAQLTERAQELLQQATKGLSKDDQGLVESLADASRQGDDLFDTVIDAVVNGGTVPADAVEKAAGLAQLYASIAGAQSEDTMQTEETAKDAAATEGEPKPATPEGEEKRQEEAKAADPPKRAMEGEEEEEEEMMKKGDDGSVTIGGEHFDGALAELAIATVEKAGRRISSKRLTKLKSIMTEFKKLLGELDPGDISLNTVAKRFEDRLDQLSAENRELKEIISKMAGVSSGPIGNGAAAAHGDGTPVAKSDAQEDAFVYGADMFGNWNQDGDSPR